MFIAVVMQLRGFASGVILTTHKSSIVVLALSFASALLPLTLAKKSRAPTTFSSTNRYLSILSTKLDYSAGLVEVGLPAAQQHNLGGTATYKPEGAKTKM